MPTLSIVIVNWNSKEYVDECIQSIMDTASSLSPEIIVVDGGSFDGCDRLVKSKYPKVKFIQSNENLGFGRSNNLGINEANGDVVALLNPDSKLRPGALQALVKMLEELPNAGAVGPRLLNSDGSLQTSCVQAFPTPINQALDSDVLRKLFPRSNLWKTFNAYNELEPSPVEALSGACIVAYRDLLSKIDGFTNDYFMYAEDMDMCKKIHDSGKLIYHVPKAQIVHYGGGSSSVQFSKFSVVMNLYSLGLYMRLRHGFVKEIEFRILMFLSAAFRLMLLILRKVVSWNSNNQSLKRWYATLSWSLGLEKWTNKYRVQN